MFDIGYATEPAAEATAAQDAADEAAREPCLPDFLLWTRPAPVGGREVVIVETMGYADAFTVSARRAPMH